RVYTEGKGEKQPVTGDKCKGNKATKELKACLQPDRRADIEIIGTK
ncbi:MAG TPA: OmpA family protein, partial [Azonexus sp.]|nr:OmpA family protein [Azonexus sp.]